MPEYPSVALVPPGGTGTRDGPPPDAPVAPPVLSGDGSGVVGGGCGAGVGGSCGCCWDGGCEGPVGGRGLGDGWGKGWAMRAMDSSAVGGTRRLQRE
ncbi:hypothetical protein [Microtetraspora fusca]|uniref:hypothetical protein n=1 Tax=Microtetraspora fusca TaxID=1997 RepID=UPI0012F7C797|nr:hypothetical protein [Microtetraspora fusca]